MRRLTLLLSILILATGAFAQTYVELVLDASGSMWNKLDDGRYRIVGAKDALSAFVRGLPDGDLNVGLRVYGSRVDALDEGACQDTDLFVPLAGVDKAALQGAIDTVSARGATPIAASLDAAAADFPATASRRVLVLVTDGQESCGGDLAKSVAGLKAAGIELRIIGFTLADKAAAAFAELATFENAADAESLATALQGVVADVAPAPVESKQATVTLDAPNEVEAGTAFQVRWSGEVGDNDELLLVTSGDPDDAVGNWIGYIGTQTTMLEAVAPLEEGPYELRYRSAGSVVARSPLNVTPSPATLKVLDQAVFAGTRFDVAWTGPDGPLDYVTIVLPTAADGDYGEYQYTQAGSPLALLAPTEPGTYELRYQSDSDPGIVVARARVDVLPPKPITLEAPAAVAGGDDVVVSWTGPDAERDYITIAPAGSAAGTYLDYEYTTAGSPLTLTAPLRPGKFEIRYSTDRADAHGRVFAAVPLTVEGTTVVLRPPATITAGTIFSVDVQGPAHDHDYITIVPVGTEDGQYGDYSYVSAAGAVELQAPDEPGAYEIRYQSDDDPSFVMGRVSVTVSAP